MQRPAECTEIIVESVVNEVREDFENAGIDEQTLQDLKNIWQKAHRDEGNYFFMGQSVQ